LHFYFLLIKQTITTMYIVCPAYILYLNVVMIFTIKIKKVVVSFMLSLYILFLAHMLQKFYNILVYNSRFVQQHRIYSAEVAHL